MSFLSSIAPIGSYGAMSSPADCRCFPGDTCWPSTSQWDSFNDTVDGLLISSVPLAAACHDYETASISDSTYNPDQCGILRQNWFFPTTHLQSSSSAMGAPIFENNSCNPFLPRDAPCVLGNDVSYSVRVRDAIDVQKTITFANEHSIRLVIRGTGHDYNGKSIGAGGLSIWTHNLTSTELLPSYQGLFHTGRAVKLGAGVSVIDAYKFADSNNGIIVGGACPTVALAGGYTQGGGHGPLASKFGLAADQVLEWEVVTSTGEFLIATPVLNSDLYWALSGGGGGTYGVVVSMTVKLHDSLLVTSATLGFSLQSTRNGSEDFWLAVKVFLESLSAMTDSGVQIIWTLVQGQFFVSPATGPGVSKDTMDQLFNRTLMQLATSGIPYEYQSTMFPTFLDSYSNTLLPGSNSSNSIIGSRMIPRPVIACELESFISALQTIVEAKFLVSGISLDVSDQSSPLVSANPYWRQTLVHAAIGTLFDYREFEQNFANQNLMTQNLIPLLDALAPGGAAYMNEADFQEPNWQSTFYGDNYERLDLIKAKYDPFDMLYALGAVGSDRWVQKKDGRLCRT